MASEVNRQNPSEFHPEEGPPAVAPRPLPADPYTFGRSVEVCIVYPPTGEILARSGLLLSALEAERFGDLGDFDGHFELSLQPAEGVTPPEGMEWDSERSAWMERRPFDPAYDDGSEAVTTAAA